VNTDCPLILIAYPNEFIFCGLDRPKLFPVFLDAMSESFFYTFCTFDNLHFIIVCIILAFLLCFARYTLTVLHFCAYLKSYVHKND